MKSRKSKRIADVRRFKTQKYSFNKWLILVLVVLSVGLIFGSGKLLFSGNASKVKAQSLNSDLKNISPEAAQQIAALIKEKESRSPVQQKVDPRLLYRMKMERGEAIAEGVAALRNDLQVDERGLVGVEITAHVSSKLLTILGKTGVETINVVAQYRSITARAPLSEIENIATLGDVIFVQPQMEYMNSQAAKSPVGKPLVSDLPEFNPADFLQRSQLPNFQTRAQNVREFLTARLADDNLTGTVNSQADTTHRAALARTLSGVNGTGLKIGVLSNGVGSLAARQASGDLPATVTVLPGQAGTGDEGTAMLELVYDLAPGAQLFYATALPSNAQFATNIKDLRTAGCDIIIDDVTYFNETPFQEGQAAGVVSPGNAGIVIQAVNDVTVGPQAGALYFSSAGNSGNKNDNTSGVWEGDFVDGGATAAPIPVGNNLHNFGGAVTQNVLLVNGRVTLKWSDPIGGSGNDYDLYILNAAGTAVVASGVVAQSGTQDPYEDAGNCFANERIVIVKKAAAAARFLHLNTNRGLLSVSTAGVVYGHNSSLNTISVAAVPAGPAQNNASVGPFPGRHTPINTVEQFSSDGPRRIFYNADSTLITPGNVSSTGGQLLQKPDITAADGTSTTTPGFIPFFGTSAAAPHAGALMALLKQASPASTRTQLYNAMVNSALDIEAPGTDRDSGAGIFMPLRAMNALAVAGPASLELGTPTTTELFGNGNGKLEPGESANMFIPLDNLGLANATGITATLSTSTPGVTILNTFAPDALAYPNLPAAVGTGTNTTPFRFGLASTFPCGAPINFTLTVNYTGGATASQVFNITINTNAQVSITSTLDATAPPAGAGYTAVTGTQTGRLNRNGVISNCSLAKAAPPLQDSVAGRRYDAYTFTASATGCTTVTLSSTNNSATNNIFLAVYNNAGYVPTTVTANYLADWGVTTGGLVTIGFNATAGQQFTVVVHEIPLATNATYTLTVGGPITGACALVPTAAGVEIAGRVYSTDGRAVRNATVTLAGADGSRFAGRTNSFGYYRIENVPSGEVYTATATAKGLSFTPRIVNVQDSIAEFDFMAEP